MDNHQDTAFDGLSDDEKRLAVEGRKIAAIKLYRERTGAGLAEAKDQVEKWLKTVNYDSYKPSRFDRPKPTKPGCGVGLLLVGMTLSGLTWFACSS